MTREELLKDLILRQYGSVSKFAQAAGLPITTVHNIFSRGLGGVGADTVVKICAVLDVDVESLMAGDLSVRSAKQAITLDSFTYAMHNETRDLPEEKKQMLLNMARFFNEELHKEKGQ